MTVGELHFTKGYFKQLKCKKKKKTLEFGRLKNTNL